MTPRPLLSVLTPAVPSRLAQLGKLSAELERQIGTLPVEHVAILDNKRRTVGEKRDALLRAARGKYVAFVDDDDGVGPDYIAKILEAAAQDPDVITFQQLAHVDDLVSLIEFRLGNRNEPFKPGGLTKRDAWHVCAWRRSLAIQSGFPANSYGEDWAYAEPLCLIKGLKEVHVDAVLHVYRHSSKTTEAPAPTR